MNTLPVDGQGFDSLTGTGGGCCSGPVVKYSTQYNLSLKYCVIFYTFPSGLQQVDNYSNTTYRFLNSAIACRLYCIYIIALYCIIGSKLEYM